MTASFQVMPDLSPDEYAGLREDIRQHGITVPIVYDQHDRIIDGHHRDRIADELGIDSDDIPWTVVHVETDEQGRDLAYRLNAHRRHLTREQKRAALELSLRADPGLSDRQHAERVGVSDKTAGAVRRELETGAEIPHQEVRTGKDGVAQPASKPARPEPAPEPDPEPRPIEGHHPPEPVPEPADPQPADAPAIKQRRLPLPASFLAVVDELLRDVGRLERLVADNRFAQNAEQVAARNRSDLLRAAQKLAAVLERLATPYRAGAL